MFPRQDPTTAQYDPANFVNGPAVIQPAYTESAELQHDDSKKFIDHTGDWGAGGFSAVDLNVYIHLPTETGIQPEKFATLSMLAVSSHRDKFPVSALSTIAPRGFTAGHRMIAGTLAFNTIERDAFQKYSIRNRDFIESGVRWSFLLQPDDLPPFDIQIVAINEMGDMSVAMLKGVTLLDSGSTYSLDQVVLTETYSYMALDRTPFQPVRMHKPKMHSGIDYSKPLLMNGGPLPSPGERKISGWLG